MQCKSLAPGLLFPWQQGVAVRAQRALRGLGRGLEDSAGLRSLPAELCLRSASARLTLSRSLKVEGKGFGKLETL